MENQLELQKQVKDLIRENRTEKAFELLAKKQLSYLDKELILLNGRFNKVLEDKRLGILEDDESSAELNKINLALIELSDKIGKSPSNISNIVHDKKGISKLVVLIPIILIAAIVAFLILKPINQEEPSVNFFNVIEGQEAYKLVYQNEGIKEFFLVPTNKSLENLKLAIKSHYKLQADDDKIHNPNLSILEYITIDNNPFKDNFDRPLSEIGIKNNDIVQYLFEYSQREKSDTEAIIDQGGEAVKGVIESIF